MNKLIHSQSLQSSCSVVGESHSAVTEQPTLDQTALDARGENHFVVIPVADVDKVSMNAIRYAKLLSGEMGAVHILLNPSDGVKMEYRWKIQNIDIPLFILESSNGSLVEPLVTYVSKIRRNGERLITIVLPVLISQKWWHRLLHNQTARLIERAFQREAGVVTIRVPFFLARTKNEEQYCKRG